MSIDPKSNEWISGVARIRKFIKRLEPHQVQELVAIIMEDRCCHCFRELKPDERCHCNNDE